MIANSLANSLNLASTQDCGRHGGQVERKKGKSTTLAITTEGPELDDLQHGDTVRMRPLPTNKRKSWKKATLVKQVAP